MLLSIILFPTLAVSLLGRFSLAYPCPDKSVCSQNSFGKFLEQYFSVLAHSLQFSGRSLFALDVQSWQSRFLMHGAFGLLRPQGPCTILIFIKQLSSPQW